MRISPAFVAFLVVGGAAAALNIGARLAIGTVASFEVAVALAFPIALTFAFVLNRAFVFGPSGAPLHIEYGRFVLVNLFALVQVWVVSVVLVRVVFPHYGMTWHADLLGHTIGVLSPVFSSYLAHKKFSFRRHDAVQHGAVQVRDA